MDARGCSTTFVYDAGERLTDKTFNGPGACDNTADVGYSYDDGDQRHRLLHEDDGRLGFQRLDPRHGGRVTQETRIISRSGGGTLVTKWGYESLDRVVWTRYPGGTGARLARR